MHLLMNSATFVVAGDSCGWSRRWESQHCLVAQAVLGQHMQDVPVMERWNTCPK